MIFFDKQNESLILISILIKIKLEKALLERTDSINHSNSLECSLQSIRDELKRYEELYEQQKNDTEQLVQTVDEQRSLISDIEIKLRVFTCEIIINFKTNRNVLGFGKTMCRYRN